MQRMKVVQVAELVAALEVVERDIPIPQQNQVRIKVQACVDLLPWQRYGSAVAGAFQWNRLSAAKPGREVVGIIDAMAPKSPIETRRPRGRRLKTAVIVGIATRVATVISLRARPVKFPVFLMMSGYAEYMIVVPFEALAAAYRMI